MLAGLIAPRLPLDFVSASSQLRLDNVLTMPWLRSPTSIVARHAITLIMPLGTKYTIACSLQKTMQFDRIRCLGHLEGFLQNIEKTKSPLGDYHGLARF